MIKEKMIFRDAKAADIEQIQIVRNSVTENTLSNPDLITDADCLEFISQRGKGWVCEIENQLVGFSIVDLKEQNVWALFLKPQFEQRGIGRKLQKLMLDWYFKQTTANLWLGTAPNTRAEKFYRQSGWTVIGTHGKGEIKFEMTYETWQQLNK
ncbi:GNAT family N-acetyltransferase [Sunxiuqinia elliptica]|uniref:Ribosomal protein S18 acetylase RimI-like enzyme n=1 Tax=Sunxiuqinia elliptica TaxID=655355 RepID=A0A4R6GRD5_9BACT|nr:GNAT family N-acetyltransferase [Sunxiuqinia elliptica]TDN97667.1 ribosomal protein S18 acetylase RimI-like enzyme [Sunxiuqinia elliptica]TDO67022.1 ribosomal protein S18 acetylase RimI-like enzyme [Sunxiuqinia elliptica]